MKLQRYSRVVRWAYLVEDKVPDRVSLCPLFWRVVLGSPLKAIFAVPVFILLSPIIAVAWVLAKLRNLDALDRLSDNMIERYDNSVIVQRAIAFKTRVCPIVEIERQK